MLKDECWQAAGGGGLVGDGRGCWDHCCAHSSIQSGGAGWLGSVAAGCGAGGLVHLGCPCGGGCLCKFMNGLDQQIWPASPSHPLLGVLSLLFRPNLQAATLT